MHNRPSCIVYNNYILFSLAVACVTGAIKEEGGRGRMGEAKARERERGKMGGGGVRTQATLVATSTFHSRVYYLTLTVSFSLVFRTIIFVIYLAAMRT